MFRFECEGCGYEVNAFAGPDVMMAGKVQPVVCEDCESIETILVRPLDPDEPGENACPTCGGKDIRPWPASHPCPRCGTTMGEGDLAMSVDHDDEPRRVPRLPRLLSFSRALARTRQRPKQLSLRPTCGGRFASGSIRLQTRWG